MKQVIQNVHQILTNQPKKTILPLLLIGLIKSIRPLLGPPGCCRYFFTCTQYAEFQLINKPLYKALSLITYRILSCNPFFSIIKRS